MKVLEVLRRLDEMAFSREAIVGKLRALQPQIISHALKIIVYPDSQEVSHWRDELIAWGNDLTAMQWRRMRRVTPMGFKMAWNGLYREPFEGAEERVLRIKLGTIERQYKRQITQDHDQIMTELTNFLRPYCKAIGDSEFVDSVVNGFGP